MNLCIIITGSFPLFTRLCFIHYSKNVDVTATQLQGILRHRRQPVDKTIRTLFKTIHRESERRHYDLIFQIKQVKTNNPTYLNSAVDTVTPCIRVEFVLIKAFVNTPCCSCDKVECACSAIAA
jgi:hypothetical protein